MRRIYTYRDHAWSVVVWWEDHQVDNDDAAFDRIKSDAMKIAHAVSSARELARPDWESEMSGEEVVERLNEIAEMAKSRSLDREDLLCQLLELAEEIEEGCI